MTHDRDLHELRVDRFIAFWETQHPLVRVLISQCAIVSNGIGLRCLFRARPTVSRQGIAFDYNSPAELHLSRRRGRHADYRRFATATEAIHYAVVELRPRRSLSAWMQVGDERFNEDEINRLYDDDDYPLRTPLSSERGSATE
jgi:hypothetical protein